jgi:hypothetical protein
VKYDKHADYPPEANNRTLTVLLTLWPSLPESVKDDVVLVGGLAVHLLTRHETNPFGPPSVTLDVDLGISLGASTGSYDTVSRTLQGIGFHKAQDDRLVRQVNNLEIAVDFLVEGAAGGGHMVDDVRATSFPGIQRALDSKEHQTIDGYDVYGVKSRIQIPVVALGPLIVLKLNAFSSRRHPKDAFDLLSLTMIHRRTAAESLAAETDVNPGFATAHQCLETFFQSSEADGPRRALAFRTGSPSSGNEEDHRILEVMTTAGKFLLEGARTTS